MGWIRVIAGVVAAAGIVSCSVLPRGRAVAENDFGGANAPYYHHAEGIKACVIDSDTVRGAEEFRMAIEADTTYAPAYYQMAELLMRQRQPEKAVWYSERANRLDSANMTYRNQLGRVLVMAGRYGEAMGIYTDLMRDDPNNPLNYTLLAALYDYKEQPFTAISILDTAEMRLGRMEELTAYKRELLIRLKLYDKALEEAKKMANDYPYDDDNYRVLGDIYAAMGSDSLALTNYKEALRLDSADLGTLSSLADFYYRKNNASDYFTTLKRIFDNDGWPLSNKLDLLGKLTSDVTFYGRHYFSISSLVASLVARYPDDYPVVDAYATHIARGGEIGQALQIYKSYLALHPDRREAYDNVIGIESYLGHPDSVAFYSDMALRYFPDNVDILMLKGYAEVSLEDYEGALASLKEAYKAAASDSLRSVVAGMSGDVYHEMGRHKQAFRQYDRAIRLNPDNAGVLNNYAYYLCEEDEALERALEMSHKANTIEPNNSTFLDTEGWILYKLGRYEEAKEIMQRAVSFDSSNSEVLLFHYGEILYALGDEFMAEVYWKRAMSKGYDAEVVEQRLEMLKDKK